MADVNEEQTNINHSLAKELVPKWASGSHLRRVEQNVLIPKIMREEAKVLCKDYVDAFTNCAKGRTLSLVTTCRNENREMQKCLQEWYFNDEFRGRCTDQYLKRRNEYQEKYAQTHQATSLERKQSTVNMGKQ